MKLIKFGLLTLLLTFLASSCKEKEQKKRDFNADAMIFRISEIEVDSKDLDEYISILKTESEASVRLEPGVISIFPMFQKENPTKIRILEIYASKKAYESHLKTPHFIAYKTTTLEMVKSLKLIDMKPIDEETIPEIFTKLQY